MESGLSCVSSLKEDVKPCFVQPHYRESYRLAIYALLCGGPEAYDEFLKAEQISHFLSDEEKLYVLQNAELPVCEDGKAKEHEEGNPSTYFPTESGKAKEHEERNPSTYFPTESDEQVPDLDLGWPEVSSVSETNISLLFHPPRQNTPTIKEVVRKQIIDAKQLIAISMDVFTDVDIFQEVVSASRRGVIVYILLDHAHFQGFLTMSQRLGVSITDLQNLRVRTVSGPQYQCQSGAKFSGALEQRFILVDCRTVLYGTYSYTWSFEKINLSMVLVVTGQLVGSYDEEFRRLYARSLAPTELTMSGEEEDSLKPLYSPSPSLLSLHQLQRPRMTNGLMTRGRSMQERLHQSHRLDPGNLVRGHSYDGELQRLNSPAARLKATERNGTTPQGGEDPPAPAPAPAPAPRPARMSQLLSRHRMRYGSDQNLIPFNSETSLNRWKIDSYFSHDDETAEAAYDVTSPQGSQLDLNEGANQMFPTKSRQMKSKLEEIRLKRLSLQEYTRQSQENLRPMFSTLERTRIRSSLRTLDKSQSMAALEEHKPQEYSDHAPADYENVEYFSPRLKPLEDTPDIQECPEMEEPEAAQQSVAQGQPPRTQDCLQPVPMTPPAAAKLDVKQKEPSLKPSGLRPSGGNTQSSRAMDPLLGIPEEKDGPSKVDSTDKLAKVGGAPAHKDANAVTPRGGRRAVSKVGSVVSSRSIGSRHQDLPKGSAIATKKDPPGARPHATQAEPAPHREATPQQTANSSASDASAASQSAVKAKGSAEKAPSPQGESTFQRKNSLKSKVYSLLSLDERKSQRKEEKTLQRKSSMRSQNPAAASQHVSAEALEGAPPPPEAERPAVAPRTPKGTLKSVSRSQNAIDNLAEKERPSSAVPLDRWSSQRSSRTQSSVSGSRLTLESEGAVGPQPQRGRVYSRFEPLLNQDRYPLDKPVRSTSLRYLGKDRNSVLNSIRQPSAGVSKNYSAYQTPSSQDNRLGRFMQRVGNLITKNK